MPKICEQNCTITLLDRITGPILRSISSPIVFTLAILQLVTIFQMISLVKRIIWCIVTAAWLHVKISAFVPSQKAVLTNNAAKTNTGQQHMSRNDFEDFSEDISSDDGKDLAKEFYQQVKKREDASRLKQSRSDDLEEYDVKSSSSKKFTGRIGEKDSTGKPSAGLFSSSGNGSVYAFPVENQKRSSRSAYSSSGSSLSQRDKMMRDEINLMRVASSEGSIVVQGLLVLLLLCFTLYIGTTGGITDGSDRFGAFDGVVNEFNGLGDSIDFSSLVTDDASKEVAADIIKDGSVWL